MVDPPLVLKSKVLWPNAMKALSCEIWFEMKSNILYKSLPWVIALVRLTLKPLHGVLFSNSL